MMDFRFAASVDMRFGRGSADTVGKEVSRFGKNAFIITSGSSARTGLLERIEKQLENEHVTYAVFDRITPNPLTTTVEEGAELFRRNGCDVILSVGGGSPLDAAKGISLLARNGGDINDYIFKRA